MQEKIQATRAMSGHGDNNMDMHLSTSTDVGAATMLVGPGPLHLMS